MREFFLYCDNVRYDLNGHEGVWLLTPSGMGATMATDYATISDGYFSVTENKAKQGSIAGELAWSSNAYNGYKSLVDAIFSAEHLTIGYRPSNIEYKADVRINYITKGESFGGQIMRTPVSFILLTPWYLESYIFGNNNTINVPAGGQMGTSFDISAIASSLLHNPVFTVTDNDGNEIQRIEFNVDIPASKEVEWSNHCYDSHITVDGVDAISNVTLNSNMFDRTKKAFKITLPTIMNYSGHIRYWWRTV